MLIRQVRTNKANKHKYITIPKDEPIEAGDYVVVKKVKPKDLEGQASIEVPQ